jgi:hypothetical protein
MLVYELAIRPWHLHWGARKDEVNRPIQGDTIISNPQIQSTRAITINGFPSEVWPWLVQMGQGQGGFYSYDWLENLIGCDIHSSARIIKDFQRLKTGDSVRLGPEGYPFYTVADIKPNEAIVLYGGTDRKGGINTWVFSMAPLDNGSTRLIIRSRYAYEMNPKNILIWRVITEMAHFVMERKMMLGIKQRVEGTLGPQSHDVVQVVLWIVTFLLLFIALVAIFLSRIWWQHLAVAFVAAAVLLLLIFKQPSIVIGIFLDLGIIMLFVWAIISPQPYA